MLNCIFTLSLDNILFQNEYAKTLNDVIQEVPGDDFPYSISKMIVPRKDNIFWEEFDLSLFSTNKNSGVFSSFFFLFLSMIFFSCSLACSKQTIFSNLQKLCDY